MNEHLSSGQISEWLIGERSAAAEEHVNNCATCRDELALFGKTMSLYRESVIHWTDGQRGPDSQTLRRVKRQPFVSAVSGACWAVATGLLCVFLSAPLTHRNDPADEANIAPVQVDTQSLLSEVDAQVSETVPDAIAPLTRLVPAR